MSAWADFLQAPVIQAIAHASLALLLGAAALHKLRNPHNFRATLADYTLVPTRLEPVFARLVPIFEATLAGLLLIPGFGPVPALAAGSLFILYGAAMALLLLRGFEVDCGCGFARGPQPIRWMLVARNGGFALVAGCAALSATEQPLAWLDLIDVAMAVGLSATLLAGFEQAGRNARRGRNLARSEGAR